MNITSADLLRLLSSGSTPSAAGNTAAADPSGFASLLQQAQSGAIASGREITVRPDAGVKLTDDQLARVALAADRAESQGAMRAAVLIDGKALALDVGTRQVTGQVELKDLSVTTGIDAVVTAPQASAAQTGPPSAPVPLPNAGPGFGNPSLLRVLSQSLGRAG